MTQEEFNQQILSIMKRIHLIREYSYGRRGAKFDPKRPNLLLCPDEEILIKQLEQQVADLCTEFVQNSEDNIKRT